MSSTPLYRPDVSAVAVMINGKKYSLRPATSCKGCAFEDGCYALPRKQTCPLFGDKQLATCLSAIYVPVERKTKKKEKK